MPFATHADAARLVDGDAARESIRDVGETVRGEPLGDGNASTRFQRFPLKKNPLTYVPSTKSGRVT